MKTELLCFQLVHEPQYCQSPSTVVAMSLVIRRHCQSQKATAAMSFQKSHSGTATSVSPLKPVAQCQPQRTTVTLSPKAAVALSPRAAVALSVFKRRHQSSKATVALSVPKSHSNTVSTWEPQWQCHWIRLPKPQWCYHQPYSPTVIMALSVTDSNSGTVSVSWWWLILPVHMHPTKQCSQTRSAMQQMQC